MGRRLEWSRDREERDGAEGRLIAKEKGGRKEQMESDWES